MKTTGIDFEEVSATRVVASLPDTQSLRNHIGGPHAAMMFGLGESTSGAVVMAAFAAYLGKATPLVVRADIAYKKIAIGPLRAEAVLGRSADEVIGGARVRYATRVPGHHHDHQRRGRDHRRDDRRVDAEARTLINLGILSISKRSTHEPIRAKYVTLATHRPGGTIRVYVGVENCGRGTAGRATAPDARRKRAAVNVVPVEEPVDDTPILDVGDVPPAQLGISGPTVVERPHSMTLSDGKTVEVGGLAAPGPCWAVAASDFATTMLLGQQVRFDPTTTR